MVTIRLARRGGKKNPFYHVTVAEKSAKRDGRFIERLGFYNPVARGRDQKLRIDLERVDGSSSSWRSPARVWTKFRQTMPPTRSPPTTRRQRPPPTRRSKTPRPRTMPKPQPRTMPKPPPRTTPKPPPRTTPKPPPRTTPKPPPRTTPKPATPPNPPKRPRRTTSSPTRPRRWHHPSLSSG
ncbi:MAG: 30S ribosomal protein S16 [Pseudomonadales bacterium]|nr:30S ribosomal protein S16 [Pseudomonadales bacterium]